MVALHAQGKPRQTSGFQGLMLTGFRGDPNSPISDKCLPVEPRAQLNGLLDRFFVKIGQVPRATVGENLVED